MDLLTCVNIIIFNVQYSLLKHLDEFNANYIKLIQKLQKKISC